MPACQPIDTAIQVINEVILEKDQPEDIFTEDAVSESEETEIKEQSEQFELELKTYCGKKQGSMPQSDQENTTSFQENTTFLLHYLHPKAIILAGGPNLYDSETLDFIASKIKENLGKHALVKDLAGSYALNVGYANRVIYCLDPAGNIVILASGPHKVYQKCNNVIARLMKTLT